MHISALLLASSFFPFCLGANTEPDVYEAIKQREAILFETIDTKDWDRIGESVTQDYVHDSRPLGEGHGGLFVGLDASIEASRAAFGTAMTAHVISNFIIRPNPGATEANVTIYAIYSRWEPTALHNPNLTHRAFVKYQDQFVVEDGTWKVRYRLVTNLAPQYENPYYNDG